MNLRAPKKKRDWFRILRDLMAAGVSMRQVAHACGRTPKSAFHWQGGGEPKDSDARTVLELYKRHCPEQWAQHMREFEPDHPRSKPPRIGEEIADLFYREPAT